MSRFHNFNRKSMMRDHFLAFMEKLIQNRSRQTRPPFKRGGKWYLPLFGVYHPRKPKQIRVVFDSSARYNGVSLNDILLKRPDLNNSLLGWSGQELSSLPMVQEQQSFYCRLSHVSPLFREQSLSCSGHIRSKFKLEVTQNCSQQEWDFRSLPNIRSC